MYQEPYPNFYNNFDLLGMVDDTIHDDTYQIVTITFPKI